MYQTPTLLTVLSSNSEEAERVGLNWSRPERTSASIRSSV